MFIHLLGGFLGSGKTTAIQQAIQLLRQRGQNVGVITNDQGTQLVDTHFLNGEHIPVTEVVGSCFCCNYPAFENHILQMEEQEKPKVLFAESVGSCTDLVATIMRPLQRFHPAKKVVLSVFADAEAFPILVQGSSLFKDSVNYIYKQQLEEADILVLSKSDRLSAYQREKVEEVLATHYPDKLVLFQNSYNGTHIEHWLHTAAGVPQTWRRALQLDYERYGIGEAELGWLNQRLRIQSKMQQAAQVTVQLINALYRSVQDAGLPIGHLKFLYHDGNQQQKISFTAGSVKPAEPISLPNSQLKEVELLINARVQTGPEHLQQLVSEVVARAEQKANCSVEVLNQEAFIPGFPKPSYRMA